MFIDEHGNIVFETIESRMISLGEFQQTFGMALQFYLDDILDNLDKIFKINWLCNKDGNKIKLIVWVILEEKEHIVRIYHQPY